MVDIYNPDAQGTENIDREFFINPVAIEESLKPKVRLGKDTDVPTIDATDMSVADIKSKKTPTKKKRVTLYGDEE